MYINKVINFLKYIFYISLLFLIIISLYPGSLLGYLLYADFSQQPNLIENLFVVGRTTRPHQVQAIISAGDGASAALLILSKEKKEGKRFCDWDEVES